MAFLNPINLRGLEVRALLIKQGIKEGEHIKGVNVARSLEYKDVLACLIKD